MDWLRIVKGSAEHFIPSNHVAVLDEKMPSEFVHGERDACSSCGAKHRRGTPLVAHHVVPSRCGGRVTIMLCCGCHARADHAIRNVCFTCDPSTVCAVSSRLDATGMVS